MTIYLKLQTVGSFQITIKYRSLAESYSDKDTRIENFGTLCTDFEKITLLIKLIDAKQNLSI